MNSKWISLLKIYYPQNAKWVFLDKISVIQFTTIIFKYIMACVRKSSDVIKICHVNIRCLPRIVPANLWQVLQVVKMISNMHKSSIDEKVTAYNNLV